MQKTALAAAMTAAFLAPATSVAATDPEIAELKAMLRTMKQDYEQRIQALERRLAKAERATSAAQESAQPMNDAASKPMTAPSVSPPVASTPSPTTGGFGALTSGSAFNPQISVILDGNYYHDGIDGAGAALVGQAFQPSGGHAHAHEGEMDAEHSHGAMQNGFNFSEAEIAFSATVDPYFDAAAYLAVTNAGDVYLEEAWMQTRNLPQGLRVKAGKFLSDFGYINRQHPHQWDFVDQNLPYLNLLGDHGLQDTGIQLTWLPALPVYTLFGVEALQGDQELFGTTLDEVEQIELDLGDTYDGPRLWTAFAKVAPDLGQNHALQVGVSYAHNNQHQEVQTHAHEGEDEVHENGFAGDASLWGVDLVYRYYGAGPQGQGDFKFQTEYLRSIKDLDVRSSPHGELIGSNQTFTTDGLYAQAIYGVAPKWALGLRYDVLGLTNEVSGDRDESYGSSDRWTVDLTWSLSEFSQLRAQYARNDILVAENEREHFDAFYLQFIVSLGSHGAHSF
ncbi:TonB-dependent receptor [Thiorhodococcus mannitoliphagus]|uniref:TonB-dependent receptor n=1 Tax=Thiorhodococcus mannitoliphagus TaxID=329406 RepID=A0A6P1E183_9GAMM|nr:TonB-dependent receptor [Thiorhodococcus mannitoliphagus]NEX23071.1 TonB-dependent receptor [Thiorhodococcus mannitoliphagus]